MAYFHLNNNTLSYPISNLNDIGANVNSSALIELVIDKYGDEDYLNVQSNLKLFGNYLVSSYSIFNVLNDVFNDKTVVDMDGETETYRYASDLYFPSAVYFKVNPYTKDGKSTIENLAPNQTISKRQLLNLVQKNGFEIDSIKPDYTYWEYNGSSWEISAGPELNELGIIHKFNSQHNNFSKFNNLFYATEEIIIDRNIFLNVIGKVGLPEDFTKDRVGYYTPEYNFWVALYSEGNILALTELHNIDDNGIAYFSIQTPICGREKIRIIMPFKPREVEIDSSEDDDLFNNINVNTVCLNYQYLNIYDMSNFISNKFIKRETVS